MESREERLGLLIWIRMSQTVNESIKASAHHLRKWELSVSQFDLLMQIGAAGKLTQQELADRLLVTKGNITHLLGKLEECGFVQREQQWKHKFVSLTEKGQQLFDEVVPQQKQFQAAHFDGLSTTEKQQLSQLLKKINESNRKKGANENEA